MRPTTDPSDALDLDWVTDLLAIGGSFTSDEAPLLAARHALRSIVDLRGETRHDEAALRACGLGLLHLPTPDRQAVSQAHLDRGIEWVGRRIARGERVLVHCRFGIGRSAVLVTCVLVSTYALSPMAAFELVKRSRPRVSPSPEQLAGLIQWSGRWRERSVADVGWTAPPIEALMELAYAAAAPVSRGKHD